MGRGFLSGIFWGCIVGVVAIFVSSQALERQQLSFPQPEAAAVEVPGGSEFDQARVETDPVLPEPETVPEAEGAAGIEVPEDEVDAPPAMDTAALEVPVPQTSEDVASLGEAPAESEDAPEAAVSEDAAVTPATGEALTEPEAPGDAPGTAVAPAPVSEPEAEGEADPAPEVAGTDAAPEAGTEIAALPSSDGEDDAPESGTAPGIVSQDAGPTGLTAPEIAEEPSLPTGDAAPTVETGSGVAPVQPEVAVTSEIETPEIPEAEVPAETEAPVLSEAEEEVEIAAAPEANAAETPAPDATDAPMLSEAEEDAGPAETDEDVAAVTPDVGEGLRVGDGPSLLRPVEGLGDAEGVETGRLPQAGGGDDGGLPSVLRIGEDPAEEVVEATPSEEAAEPMPADAPALQRYAVEFENTGELPMLAIVLVHTGQAPPTEASLAGLPPNVAFAVDASRTDASVLAGAYRDAGREVVMIPALPAGAAPQDVEQALNVNLNEVPEAVALMDVSGSSFQSDRTAVAQIVAVAGATGHGLITFPRGLNTAHQEAGRAGVPAGLIFRDIDGDGETQDQIARALDRAAFRARQDEAVILVGTSADATLAAIVEWSQGSRAATVTLAPVSAALLTGG